MSDKSLEDEIYDSYEMQNFIGINFLEEQVPGAITLLKLRHLPEENSLGEAIFNNNKDFSSRKEMRGGTIVDATIIHFTSSTKNKEGKRDPEMHRTKKRN